MLITPAISSSTPISTDGQRRPSVATPRKISWAPATRNWQPMMTPVVFTDAESNCRTTSATTIHAVPATSHTHQRPPPRLTAEVLKGCSSPSPSLVGQRVAQVLLLLAREL